MRGFNRAENYFRNVYLKYGNATNAQLFRIPESGTKIISTCNIELSNSEAPQTALMLTILAESKHSNMGRMEILRLDFEVLAK